MQALGNLPQPYDSVFAMPETTGLDSTLDFKASDLKYLPDLVDVSRVW